MTIEGYFLGCPIWGMKAWVGSLYRRGSPSRQFLAQYASVFNTVEGNTTFYHLPRPEIVERWGEDTPEGFRFCFKLWRAITHERRLVDATAETAEFFDRLAPLGPRLGPFMVQLPPSFGPDGLEALANFLPSLPSDFHYTIELRHAAFFTDSELVKRTEELLIRHGCERTIFDTRALRSGDDEHPAVRAARQRKPDLPTLPVALGQRPFLRFIGHLDEPVNEPWIELWLPVLARWISEGRRPYVMVHTPDDSRSPALSRTLHERLGKALGLAAMPDWPGEERPSGEQLSLFA